MWAPVPLHTLPMEASAGSLALWFPMGREVGGLVRCHPSAPAGSQRSGHPPGPKVSSLSRSGVAPTHGRQAWGRWPSVRDQARHLPSLSPPPVTPLEWGPAVPCCAPSGTCGDTNGLAGGREGGRAFLESSGELGKNPDTVRAPAAMTSSAAGRRRGRPHALPGLLCHELGERVLGTAGSRAQVQRDPREQVLTLGSHGSGI